MTIKVTYNVTDVYMTQSVSPVYINVSYPTGGTSGGGTWGTITGTLSNQTDLQTALDLKVPYTGATANVDLGEYELKAGQVEFDQTPTGTAGVGVIRWNDADGTLDLGLKGGNVTLQVGQEQVARVVNKTGANLLESEYKAVRISGAQGQRLGVNLAQANNDANSADTIGIVTENIDNNQEGFITTVGTVREINTTGSLQGETWVDGDVLYLSTSTAGAITNVKPNATQGHIVVIGYVEYAHAIHGKIYVKVMNGWELGELHDVYAPTPSNNDALIFETSSALWKNKTIATALGFTPANAATTLTINGVTYDLSTSRTWTIAAGISGSGASGQVTYWTGSSAVSGSNNLFWDNANGRLGIGTNAAVRTLNVNGRSLFGSATNPQPLGSTHTVDIVASTTDSPLALIAGSGNMELWKDTSPTRAIAIGMATPGNAISNDLYFSLFNGTSWNTRFVITNSTGNISIGTTSDLGTRLGVVGDTLLRGSGATSATTALTVQNSSSTNLFRVRNNGTINMSLLPTSATGLVAGDLWNDAGTIKIV